MDKLRFASVLDTNIGLDEAAGIIGVSVDVARQELEADGLLFSGEHGNPRVRLLMLAAYLDTEWIQNAADAAMVRERQGSNRVSGATVRRQVRRAGVLNAQSLLGHSVAR